MENRKDLDLHLIRASAGQLEEIRQAYIQVIDRTQHMKTYARWIYGLHPTDEMIRSYLDSGAMYLLLDGTDLAGMMAVTMSQGDDYHEIAWERQLSDTEVAVVHILAVMPEYQKQGLGRKMIEETLRLAKENGKKAIRLDALASNLPAHRLYESMGFSRRDRKHLYAENTGWTDFLFFERDVSPYSPQS